MTTRMENWKSKERMLGLLKVELVVFKKHIRRILLESAWLEYAKREITQSSYQTAGNNPSRFAFNECTSKAC